MKTFNRYLQIKISHRPAGNIWFVDIVGAKGRCFRKQLNYVPGIKAMSIVNDKRIELEERLKVISYGE